MNDCMTQEDAMNMNSEQAVSILIPLRDMMRDQHGCPISDAYFALDKAIEALKQLTHPNTPNTLNALDTISRQAAIDTAKMVLGDHEITRTLQTALHILPSAQPEQQHGRIFQEIVVEYPSISTYTEYIGKPYFSIKYTENGQKFIGYGTYKPEVLSEYLKEYFMPSAQPKRKWIPCSERLPEKDTCFYLATIANHGLNFTTTLPDDVDIVRWDYDRRKGRNSWHWCTERTVIAWMPLPEPYAERREE